MADADSIAFLAIARNARISSLRNGAEAVDEFVKIAGLGLFGFSTADAGQYFRISPASSS